MFIDLFALRFWDSEHAQRGVAVHGKLERLGPDLASRARIDLLLLSKGGGVQNFLHFFAAACDLVDVDPDQPSEGTRCSAEVERLAGVGKELDPAIPILAAVGLANV